MATEAASPAAEGANMPRPARREILDRLVGEGRLDREDADSIERAPGLAFSTPELAGYLAGLIVVVGLIRLLAAAEASPSAIAIALLLTGSVSAISTRRITGDSTARQRLIEMIEVATVAQFAIAVGILLDQHLLESAELSVAVIATVALVWGLSRLRTQIAGWVITSSATLVATTAWVAVADLDERATPPVFLVVASGLVGLAAVRRGQPGAVLARLAAAGTVVVVSMIWFGTHDGVVAALPLVTIGLGAFALGATEHWLEIVVAGAITVLIGLVGWVLDSGLGDVVQGVVIVGIGALSLLAVVRVTRTSSVNDHG
jgi:hypothetical protein